MLAAQNPSVSRHLRESSAVADRTPVYIGLAYLVFWTALAINPVHRFDWMLENILIFLSVGALLLTYRAFRFSNASYLLIALFMALHTVGAHYTYAETPVESLFGGVLHNGRNNFDRLVHTSFGLLIALPALEVLVGLMKVPLKWAYGLAVIVILAAGAFFELIEMWVANIVAPDLGAMYLGSQGDVWDAQQDIAVAMYGAAVTMAIVWAVRRWRASRQVSAA